MEISIFAEGESICIIWSEIANEFVHLKTSFLELALTLMQKSRDWPENQRLKFRGPTWLGSEVHLFRLFFRWTGLAAFFLPNIDLIVLTPVSLGLTMAIDYEDCDGVLSISSIMLVSLSKFVTLQELQNQAQN